MFLLTTKKTIFALVIIILSFGFTQKTLASSSDVGRFTDVKNHGGHAGGGSGSKAFMAEKHNVEWIEASVLRALPYYASSIEYKWLEYKPAAEDAMMVSAVAKILYGKDSAETVLFESIDYRPIGVAIKSFQGYDMQNKCFDDQGKEVDAYYISKNNPSKICLSLSGLKENKINVDQLFSYLLPLTFHELAHRVDNSVFGQRVAEFVTRHSVLSDKSYHMILRGWRQNISNYQKILRQIDYILKNNNNLCNEYSWLAELVVQAESFVHSSFKNIGLVTSSPAMFYAINSLSNETTLNLGLVCIMSGESAFAGIRPGYKIESYYYSDGVLDNYYNILSTVEKKHFSVNDLATILKKHDKTKEFAGSESMTKVYEMKVIDKINTLDDLSENLIKMKNVINNFIQTSTPFLGSIFKQNKKVNLSSLKDYLFIMSAVTKQSDQYCEVIIEGIVEKPVKTITNQWVMPLNIEENADAANPAECSELIDKLNLRIKLYKETFKWDEKL